MKSKEVLVIGGGLAGLSCALDLAQAGVKVTLVEGKPYMGGRTASWNEKGMEVESGLHKFLGFYSALPRLIKKAGIKLSDVVQWEDEIEMREPGGPTAVFGAAPLYNPLQTAAGALGNGQFISWKDKWSLAKFFSAGLFAYFFRPEWLDTFTVSQFADRCGVTANARRRVLVPSTAGIFFLPPEDYSAYALLGLMGPYLLRMYRARVGAFKGGMSEVMSEPVARAITKAGGTIVRSAEINSLIMENGSVKGAVTKEGELRADCVVLATDIGAAQRILKTTGNDPRFDEVLRVPTMSAVTIQLELSKPAFEADRVLLPTAGSIGGVGEQSRTTFKRAGGRVSAYFASPEPLLTKKPEELAELFYQDMEKLGVPLRNTVQDFRVITEPKEFYALVPGSEKLRPKQETAVAGLVLAGDYTKQRYLATMEGAVVSGELAAKAVRRSL